MATVTVVTAERTLEIEATSIVDGEINSAGHLILTRHDGTPIDMGAVSGMQMNPGAGYSKVDAFSYIGASDPGAVPDGSVWYDTTDVAGPVASSTQKGLVELATNAETIAGTDTQRAVTPASLASIPGTKVQIVTGITEAAASDAYPTGLSFQSLTTGSGWSLNNGFGAVITSKVSGNRCQQTFYSSSGGTNRPRSWVRTYNDSDGGGGWTKWAEYTTLVTLTPASFVQTTAFTSYPAGWSRLYYTPANSTGWDFSGKYGEVLTYTEGTDFAKQRWTLHAKSGTTVEIWERAANSTGGWSSWYVVAADTGWVNLPYVEGFTAGVPGQLRYRVRAGVMYITGGATGTYTAGDYRNVVAAGSIPTAYRPQTNHVRGGAMGFGMRPCGYEVNTNGSINLGYNELTTAPSWIGMTTSYPIG